MAHSQPEPGKCQGCWVQVSVPRLLVWPSTQVCLRYFLEDEALKRRNHLALQALDPCRISHSQTLQSTKYIRTNVALERSIYIDENISRLDKNTRESMSILPESLVSLTATQKSWRGLGSEAEAIENAIARSTMYARVLAPIFFTLYNEFSLSNLWWKSNEFY